MAQKSSVVIVALRQKWKLRVVRITLTVHASYRIHTYLSSFYSLQEICILTHILFSDDCLHITVIQWRNLFVR